MCSASGDIEHGPLSVLDVYDENLESWDFSPSSPARQPSSNAKGSMTCQVVLNYNVQSILEHEHFNYRRNGEDRMKEAISMINCLHMDTSPVENRPRRAATYENGNSPGGIIYDVRLQAFRMRQHGHGEPAVAYGSRPLFPLV